MKLGDIIKNVAPAFLGGIIGQMLSGGSRDPFRGSFESGGILFPGDDDIERYPKNGPDVPGRRPTPPVLLPEEVYKFPDIFGSGGLGNDSCAKCRAQQIKNMREGVMNIADPCRDVCSSSPGPIIN